MPGSVTQFNQSETTFVLTPSRAEATRRLRSFTPAGAEVVGAGHNALGAWWWLATAGRIELDADGGARFAQEIGDRVLPVEVLGRAGRPAAIALEQAPPEFGRTVSDPDELADALGLTAGDLLDDCRRRSSPPGRRTCWCPSSIARRSTARGPTPRGWRRRWRAVGGQGCYLYCLEPVDPAAAAHTRFFNPTVGIWEDPATGSAAGPLVSRLVAQGLVPEGRPVLVEQGHAMGRPSQIQVEVDGARVRIGGAGVVVAEGTLTV